MSKSKCTQRRYRKANHNQKTLDAFFSSVCSIPAPVTCSEPVTIWQESVEVEIPPAIRDESVDVEMPFQDKDEENGWEDDLEECTHGCGVSVRGWQELREKIKKDLKKGGNTSSITIVNQLLVLRNFATLQLKGYGKIEASVQIARQWHEGEGKHYAWKI